MEKNKNLISSVGGGRYESLDSLKFILIFFVIYGHVSEHYICESQVHVVITNFIYTFHMPLFILLSGFFSKKLTTTKFFKEAFKLLLVFLIFDTTYYTIFEDFNFKEFILTPWFHLWYIPCLLLCRTYILIMRKFNKYYVLLFTFIVAISLDDMDFSYRTIFAINRTIHFLPFFVTGYYLNNSSIKKIYNTHIVFPISILLMTLTTICVFFNTEEFSYPMGCYIKTRMDALCYSPFQYLSSIIISLSVVSLCRFTYFSEYGKKTLFIYIYHMFILNIIYVIFSYCNIESTPFICFMASVLTIIILTLLSDNKMLNRLLLK